MIKSNHENEEIIDLNRVRSLIYRYKMLVDLKLKLKNAGKIFTDMD